MLWPPRVGDPSLAIGGKLRARAEDFEVIEIPAYPADGRTGHLLLTMTKRGLDTEAALAELARRLKVPRIEIGLAGLKDRHAHTTQWISLPAHAEPRLSSFRHPAIELGPAEPHGHKLRRGHLRGNRFRVVVRDLELPFEQARVRALESLSRFAEHGLPNYYGEQRFGHGGRNLEVGLAALKGRGPRRRKADLQVSAGQAGLFNFVVAERLARGTIDRVLVGDVLHKRSGGMFESTDAQVDQVRLDSGELDITGPIFGSAMRWPSPGSPAERLEHELLFAALGLEPERLARLGRAVPGTRRVLKVRPDQVEVEPEPEPAIAGLDLSEGVALRFTLPAGSYATVLLREVCG